MAKFRFYMVSDWDAGLIKGTDSEEVAQNYADSEEWTVIDSEVGVSFECEGGRSDIPEVSLPERGEDDDLEDQEN